MLALVGANIPIGPQYNLSWLSDEGKCIGWALFTFSLIILEMLCNNVTFLQHLF